MIKDTIKEFISIYVHIPWCVHKCPYCDFNSHGLKNSSIVDHQEIYTSAVTKQIKLAKLNSNIVIHSIFFGGGTPSLFSPIFIDKILTSIYKNFSVKKGCEITLEANPGTIDQNFFHGYKEIGVNRISLGIQSFNDKHLKSLERIHDRNQAINAARLARKIFDNINLDLMFALPNQAMSELQEDINTAISIEADHLSYYHLTIEPNTIFHKFPPHQPDEDLSADMGDEVSKKLTNCGYQHYETSAYARDNKECIHNLNYWTFGNYLGVGAGACSKISITNGLQRRLTCYKNPNQYVNEAKNNNFYMETKEILESKIVFEFMMNALRLNQGFTKKLFEKQTKLNIKKIKKELAEAKDKKFILETSDMIIPTQFGRNFLNELLQIFMKD